MSNGNNFHFTFNFHAPVGQQIARVDKLVAHFDKDMTMQVVDTDAMMNSDDVVEAPSLPEILCPPQAEALHAKLRNAGWMDERWNPVGLSNAEKGTLAEYLSEKLDIHSHWKFFGRLWNINSETLRTSKARGLDQEKTWNFRSKLDDLSPNPY
jgi:hypothetical protein